MTIRFAPASNRNALLRTVAWRAAGRPLTPAGNDNGPLPGEQELEQELLAETLRHFAVHGLSAAERARSMAIAAARSDDTTAYKRWLAVCRMLDKRMAGALAVNEEFANL